MVWVPMMRVEILRDAAPVPSSGTEPRVILPSEKTILPDGTALPSVGRTIALMLTVWP